jgi:hypothetical protein
MITQLSVHVSANNLAFNTTNQNDFNEGTYNQTFYNTTGFVQLNISEGYTTGNYTSRVFDAGSLASWNNISWGYDGGYVGLYFVDVGQDVYKSLNQGYTWILENDSFNGVLVDAVEIVSDSNGTLYIVDVNGDVWNSTTFGRNWTQVYDDYNGGETQTAKVMIADNNGSLYIFEGDEDVWRSDDFGASWAKINDDFDGSGESSDAKGAAVNSTNSIFVVADNADVYASTDQGVTWTEIEDDYNGAEGNAATDMVSNNDSFYILNGQDLWKSTNNGFNWTKINDDYNGDSYGNNGLTMIFDRNNYLYIADTNENIYRSTNYGLNFALLASNVNGGTGNILSITSYNFTSFKFQVRSDDDNSSWGSFIGPDGKSTTYYTNSTLENLNVSDNRYFQYRAYFITKDTYYTPKLYNVTINYTRDYTPNITALNYPGNNSWVNSISVDFNFTVEDDSGFTNCTLYGNFSGNWVTNETITTIVNASVNNITIIPGDGTYIWNVLCYDDASTIQSDWYDYNYTVNVDTTKPNIVLNAPSINTNTTNNWVLFNFTVTDNIDSSLNCSLYINESANATNSSTANNTATTFNITNMVHNTYEWNINCTDDADNTNTSETRIFFVNQTPILTSISDSPDPIVGGSSIYISPSGIDDPQTDSLYYYCSESSIPNGSNNICSGNNVTTYSYPYSTMNCSFTTATNDASHTIYCRVYDGIYYSAVKNTTYTIDSTPPTLSTVSVAGDTASPYYDNVNDGWTNTTVSGETGMSCRWEDQDHGYSSMPGDAAHTCSVSGNQATCSPQNLIQSLTTNIYVSCKDSLENENNATNNLDISVVIDWTAPTTTDNSSTTIVVPPYIVNITESDNLYGTASITTKYCTDTVGTCTPNTEIDHGGTVTFTSSNRGQNFFRYNSSDPAGNIQTIQNKTININRLPTFTSATDNAETIKGGTTVTISTVSSDADSGQTLKLYVCNSTSANSSGCTHSEYCSNTSASANPSCSFTSESDDTIHTWYTFVYDSLNEAAVTNHSGSYTIDSTPLSITIIYPENITYTTNNVTAAVSLVESGNWSDYCLDNCASNVTMTRVTSTYFTASMTGLSDGSHRIVFYVNDSVGNMANSSTRYFTVDTSIPDTTPPIITVWLPTNGTYYTSSSVTANITLNEAGSSATYSVNGTANVSMSNITTTNWNATIVLNDGEHNITFYANDTSTNRNTGTFSPIYLTVDTSAPQNTTQGPSTSNDTVNITCYSRWTDNIGLNYGYLEHNETGTATNSSQISLLGTSGWVNATIDASITNSGIIQCKAYVFDKAGLVNTSTWLVNVTDATNPVVENITYTPNNTDDLDPNVMVRISANVSDNKQLNSVILQYKLTNVSTWNTSTMNFVSGNMYTGNFTPTEGNWSFRINATDSYGNENVTDMTNISVGLDRSWTNTTNIPSVKSIVRTWPRVFSLGNLTINNTGDYDLNFTVTSNRDWITLNGTNTSIEFILNKTGNSTTFNVTTNTTGFAVGEYTYTITINSYTTDSILVSSQNISGTVIIQNVAGPYFDVKIVIYDSSVTQGDSGISLKSSIENVGTGSATGTWLAWTLPSGWSVASGTANVSVGFLGVGEIVYNSITIYLSSSADTGSQTLMSSAGCLQGITDNDTKTVTVSTSETVTTTIPSAATGGGGGAGTAAIVEKILSGEEILSSSETFDLVRGYSNTFPVNVKNIFEKTSLYNVSIKIEGYNSQYMTFSPSVIDKIGFGETKQFKVTILSPEYMEKGTHKLTIVITGKIIGTGVKKDLTETRVVTLVIHTVSEEDVSKIIELAMSDIKAMSDAGFSTTKISKILEDAKKSLDDHNYDDANDLAETIRTMKENAFKANDLIQEVKSKVKRYVTLSGAFLGAPKGFGQTEEVLNLAIAAFEREDYETALKRAEDARLTLTLEKGEFNLIFFLADYWWVILISIALSSVSGIFGYQRYVKVTISQKIKNLEKEEETIRKLMEGTQRKHFEEKTMGEATFGRTMSQYQKRLSRIGQLRTKLRHKRLRLLKPEKIIKDLEEERKDVLNLLKNLQSDYFVEHKVGKAEYNEHQKVYNERLAEIEDESLTLETKLSKKAG